MGILLHPDLETWNDLKSHDQDNRQVTPHPQVGHQKGNSVTFEKKNSLKLSKIIKSFSKTHGV